MKERMVGISIGRGERGKSFKAQRCVKGFDFILLEIGNLWKVFNQGETGSDFHFKFWFEREKRDKGRRSSPLTMPNGMRAFMVEQKGIIQDL